MRNVPMALPLLVGRALRTSEWLRRRRILRESLKTALRAALWLVTLGRGLEKNIGSSGAFRMDYAFAFVSYDGWGQAHNRGFGTVLDLCADKRVVFDVGAHIGLYTMPMSRAVGPGGAVYAFEPARGNLRHLRRHLKYNSLRNVEILPFVVGEESRDGVRFFEAATADGMGGVLVYKHAERYRESTLPQISLDDFCLERGVKPELIKIDVKGAEIRVLHGARRLLAECSPDIVLSVHPNHLRLLGESVDALRELISSAGYRLLDLDGSEPEELVLDEYLLLPSRPA